MKSIVGALTLSLLVTAPAVFAETLQPESSISAVTVFSDRAAVTRTLKIKLDSGMHTLEIGPLPGNLEPDSVTAKGVGESAVTLYGVRIITKQLENAQDANVKQLEEAIRKVASSQQALRNTKQILEQERKYLFSIQAASSEQIGKDLITKGPNAAEAQALLAFLDEALTKTYARDQEADAQQEVLANELNRLQRELGQLAQAQRSEVVAAVDLESRERGELQLEVSYRVYGASWQTSYEARVATATDAVQLGSFGLVRQQTGEEWNDVKLTLSTAHPAVSGTMPEIQPVYLKPWEPPVVYARNAQKPSRMAMLDKAEEQNEPMYSPSSLDSSMSGSINGLVRAKREEAQVATASVEAQGPSVSYVLPKSMTVPSDWQPHKAPIAVQNFSSSLAYEVTPRLTPAAFLRAKVKNTTEQLYLPGSVSVFLDGAFIATAALKQVSPGEEFDLYLGVDERIKVERKPLKERVEVSLLPGLRGKTKSTDYELLTTIENYTGRKASIAVFDLIPVSQREEIVVESVRQAPAEIKKDDEKPGVFNWQLELAPSQKQELRLAYRVRHPVDMRIE